jgi:hypothetical protein
MERLLPVLYLLGAAMIVLIAKQLITASRASRRANAIEKRACSEEALAVTLFWFYALMRDWEPRKPLNEAQLRAFRNNLQTALATAYVDSGAYPDLGVFYYAPHTYGVDPLLSMTAQMSGIAYGDILQSMLPSIRMRISTQEIAIRRLCDNDWTVVWRVGQGDACKIIDLGKEKRPRRTAA